MACSTNPNLVKARRDALRSVYCRAKAYWRSGVADGVMSPLRKAAIIARISFIDFPASRMAKFTTSRAKVHCYRRGLQRGQRYSFSLPAQGESETLHLFESAVDALSYATLLRMHGRDWQATHLLSLAKRNLE